MDEHLESIFWAEILPARLAMQAAYFDQPPTRPITVLLFSNEDTYRDGAKRLYFDRDVTRFGYYKPGRRVLLVNLAEGTAPVRHELTHALMAADFPMAPPWLKEGLATMHEAVVFDGDAQSLSIDGRRNWRFGVLQRALADDRLPSLHELTALTTLHGPGEAVNFAIAQGFCLFLQQRGQLGLCYRGIRDNQGDDPSGRRTLDTLLPGFAAGAVDIEFHQWATAAIGRWAQELGS